MRIVHLMSMFFEDNLVIRLKPEPSVILFTKVLLALLMLNFKAI